MPEPMRTKATPYRKMTHAEREYLSARSNVIAVRDWCRHGKLEAMADRLDMALAWMEFQHGAKRR